MLTLMSELAARWESFKDERGASMVEYALLVVLIAIIAILAITFAGNQVSETFSEIGSALIVASAEVKTSGGVVPVSPSP